MTGEHHMPDAALNTRLRDLFEEVAEAHHNAFVDEDGLDPEWPLWYADYLQAPIGNALDIVFLKSQLIYCLMDADFEHQVRAPNTDWQAFYADQLIERFAPAATPKKDNLALYYFPSCPFCRRVLTTIDEVGIDVDLRDIHADGQYWDELVAARQRPTVPVLRITSSDGDERWMPESRDIITYLEKNYGQEQAAPGI